MDQPDYFDRTCQLGRLSQVSVWDVIVIGGGATGLGIAVDAASRGYKVLLLEQADFAKGTSSRSTKLVHGGVRYLAQGQVKMVYGALHERGILLQNAPHLVRKQAFIIPCYSWWEKLKYLLGLKLYQFLSGRFSFGKVGFVINPHDVNGNPGSVPAQSYPVKIPCASVGIAHGLEPITDVRIGNHFSLLVFTIQEPQPALRKKLKDAFVKLQHILTLGIRLSVNVFPDLFFYSHRNYCLM